MSTQENFISVIYPFVTLFILVGIFITYRLISKNRNDAEDPKYPPLGGRVANILNPLLDMKLQEFVVADDDGLSMRHYFRFQNKDGKDEEFVVSLQCCGSDLVYSCTYWRKTGDTLFVELSEVPWSIPISYLIELGQKLSVRTRPTKGRVTRAPS
jgi:hypothetical protein